MLLCVGAVPAAHSRTQQPTGGRHGHRFVALSRRNHPRGLRPYMSCHQRRIAHSKRVRLRPSDGWAAPTAAP